MPAFLAVLVGSIVGGLTQFFATRAGSFIAGLGFMYVAYKGLDTFVAYAVSDIQTLVQVVNNSGGSIGGGVDALKNIGGLMVAFASFAGLFDSANILISGVLALKSLQALKFALARAQA